MSVQKVSQPINPTKKLQSRVKYKKQRRRQSKRRSNILLGFALAIVSMTSAAAGALLAFTFSESSLLQQATLSVEEEQVFSQEETVEISTLSIPELSRPVNILVLGIKVLTSDLKNQAIPDDLGYHALVNSFEGLSDTMLLVRFDPVEEKLTVLSIPRDTRTHIDGYGIGKINHANYQGGPALSASTISELLGGVEIDRYVRVNVQGVEKLIDALGGVTVDIPKDMKYNDFSQHFYVNLKKGKQHLNGDQAMQFLRFRYDNLGDIARVQRQQMLMRSIVEQALRPATIVKVPQILDVVKSHLDTNLTIKELMALSSFAAKTNRSDLQMIMLPGDFNNPEDKVSYWLPDERRIQKVVVQHFDIYPEDYDGWEARELTRVRIAIQNTLENDRPARKLLAALQEAGYTRAYMSRSLSEPLGVTKIVAQAGDDLAAKNIRAQLGGIGEVLVESTGVLSSDITIQVGQDWENYLEIDELTILSNDQ
ncbi:MAG: LCP family protein [Xenococcus sp. (in: cyanobacteria)]